MHPTRLDRHEATCGNASMSGYGRTVGEIVTVGEGVTKLNAVVADPHNNNCERACMLLVFTKSLQRGAGDYCMYLDRLETTSAVSNASGCDCSD